MSRVILRKGSPEAIAWAVKMQAAREKKKKSIRELGKHREIQHFGEMRKNPKKPHGKFVRCVKAVQKKKLPKGSSPQAICGAALRKNPPHGINAGIAGVIYNRCVEIRAEKTTYEPGYYRHPFSRKAKVCVLALDNGDILIHSKAGVNLWKPA